MPTQAATIPEFGISDVPDISGPTAADMSSAISAQSVPRSIGDYNAMGISGNSAMDAMRQWKQEAVMTARKKAFEALISKGEEGADLFIQDASRITNDFDGQGASAWLPPKEQFYKIDPQAGMRYFDSVEYLQHAYAGLKEFQKTKIQQETEARKQEEMTQREASRNEREKKRYEIEAMRAQLYNKQMELVELDKMYDDAREAYKMAESKYNEYVNQKSTESLMDKDAPKYNEMTDVTAGQLKDAAEMAKGWLKELEGARKQRSKIITSKKPQTGAGAQPAPTQQPGPAGKKFTIIGVK